MVPVRNGGDLFRACVHSVLAQTHDEFELLVLDNACSDGSLEWLHELNDPRIRLHSLAAAVSIENNWARITTVPKAEYMTILGHDDLLDPGFLQVMDSLVTSQPDAALFHAHFRLIDGQGHLIRSCRPLPEQEAAASFLQARLRRERDSFGTGYVCRSSEYDAVGGMPSFRDLLFADDALWLRLIGPGVKVTAAAECYSYRLHGGSTSGRVDRLSLLRALSSYVDELEHLSAGDPALAGVVRQDLPAFVRHDVRSWYVGQLVDSSARRVRGLSLEDAGSALHSLNPLVSQQLATLHSGDPVSRTHVFLNAHRPLRPLHRYLTKIGSKGAPIRPPSHGAR